MRSTASILSLVVGPLLIISPIYAGQLLEYSSAWELGVREDLAAREYSITWQDQTPLPDVPSAWHAPNRAQGVRTYFTPDGIHMIPREAGRTEWRWGLSLIAYGRGRISHQVDQAKLYPDENRIRLDRHRIDEWFVNEPRGLKHGFVLHMPPDDGQESTDALHLDLRVGGILTPVVGADGQSVRFAGTSGMGVVYYRGLEVRDALGRVMPAWMEAHLVSGEWIIRLSIDDRKAYYPITIDPLATSAAWTQEINQEEAWFGIHLGSAGDVNADGFDDVIVGAFFFDNGQTNEGAAFFYFGSESGPSETYDWMVESDEPVAKLGRSVGTAGDVNNDGYDDVIIGVPGLDNGGGAWVFHGSATGLLPHADWAVQSDQPTNSNFGFMVGTAGDVNNDGYDDVIVGAQLYDEPPFIQPGRAYVYHGSAAGLSTVPNWTTSGGQNNASYGISVGTAGDVNNDSFDDVIVGANQFTNGEFSEGRAFVFHGSAAGLSMEPDWTFENDVEKACLGVSVGTAGDVNNDGYGDVIVGAPFEVCWNFPTSPLGRAYTFRGSIDGLEDVPHSVSELVQTGAIFGRTVATAGDVNNDGYDDVAVGASHYDNDQTDEGAVFVYLGLETGLSVDFAWMAEGEQSGAEFGSWVATADDVDGDGIDDLIVGARVYDNGEVDEGRTFVYQGSATVTASGRVSTDTPLLLARAFGHALQLTWGSSCLASDTDYEVYEGQLGDFSSHSPRLCSTGGQATAMLVPSSGAAYFLVVPRNLSWEGSYGTTNGAVERPPGTPACLLQAIGSCK